MERWGSWEEAADVMGITMDGGMAQTGL